jgi:hypothetical protein
MPYLKKETPYRKRETPYRKREMPYRKREMPHCKREMKYSKRDKEMTHRGQRVQLLDLVVEVDLGLQELVRVLGVLHARLRTWDQ